MVVVSHLFLFLRKSFRGRFDSCESNLPLFGTIYFPTARFSVQFDGGGLFFSCILGKIMV